MKKTLLFSFSILNTVFSFSQTSGFTENKGQLCDQDGKAVSNVLFRASMRNAPSVFITDKGLTYLFLENIDKQRDVNTEPIRSEKKFSKIEMELEGANIKKDNVSTETPLEGVNNYYYANCPQGILDVQTYKKVTIKNIYNGIDWVIYTNEKNNLEYDFIVNPGADASQIKIKYRGANDIGLDKMDQRLNLSSAYGKLFEGDLYSYEKESGEKVNSFYKKNKREISFALGNYDKSKTIVIDPPLQWSVLQAGSGNDYSYAIATAKDLSGKSFITGYTDSPNYPTMNAYQGTLSGPEDMVVTALNSAGVKLWSTYYGGTNLDGGKGIAVDLNSNVYVVGYSASINFPVLNPYQNGNAGTNDAVVVKFNSTGVRQWATYFGGVTNDQGVAITSDNAGNIFITGYTNSTNFPVKHAIQTVKGTGYDTFIAKFLSTGILSWSNYMGANDDDKGRAICLNANGTDLYFAGSSLSGAGFATAGVFQLINASPFVAEDAFIAEFDTSAQTKVFCTFCGGSDIDIAQGIAVDPTGKIYITGYTLSSDFPTLNPGGTSYFDNTIGSPATHDAFIVACNANATTKLWGTYFGGSAVDMGLAVNFDPNKGLYVTGATASTDFPVLMPVDNNFYQSTQGDAGIYNDVFIAWFYNFTREWSTYVGGVNDDEGFGVSTNSVSEIFVTGISNNDVLTNKYAPGVLNSIRENENDMDVTVFPNPASNQLIVDNRQLTNSEFVITDVSGKELLREKLKEEKTQIDISKFAAGIYFIKISDGEKYSVKKFVKR